MGSNITFGGGKGDSKSFSLLSSGLQPSNTQKKVEESKQPLQSKAEVKPQESVSSSVLKPELGSG
jgi:hypothetical protein